MKFSDNINEAVYLIDDKYIARYRNTPESGWDLFSSGIKKSLRNSGVPTGVLECDGNNVYKAEMRRDFRRISGGKAAVNFAFNTTALSGLYFVISDADNVPVSSLYLINGVYFFCGKSAKIGTNDKNTFFGIEFDFENKTQSLLYNGKHIMRTELLYGGISHLDIGFEPHSVGKLTLLGTKLWTNFLFNDRNFAFESGDIADIWSVNTENGAKAYRENIGSDDYRFHVFSSNTFECPEKSAAFAYTQFEKICSKLALETKYLCDLKAGTAEISLLSGKKSVLTLFDDGEWLYCNERKLKKHSQNVWQTLYTEIDIKNGCCRVMLDGTKCGEVRLSECDFIDGAKISYTSEKSGIFRFCDTFAHEIKPEPEDYVPKPQIPEKLDYSIGINVCSLWRNGHHRGWDPISAFYENRLLLGYYDEGIPELADWEIKYMAEHGIDFQMFCWFNSEKNSPICNTQLQEALNDGYFKAKYSESMKFCIIFEVANGTPFTSESFRKYIVPYWVDYFFTNPNYMTLDNKLIISAFGLSAMYKMLGSPEKARPELEYLDDTAKSLGFDGVIVICNEKADKITASAGVDAVYAYNHGYNGYSEFSTKTVIEEKKKNGAIHVIPTLSVGYNEVAWRDFRAPMMSTQTMGKLLSWFKSDALLTPFGNEEWKKKLVIMSTWNEYGEGTYMCPANLNGFGYLDEIRRAFTKEDTAQHKDIVPSKAQLDRICYLFPENRTRLCAQLKVQPDSGSHKVIKRYVFDSACAAELWKAEGLEYGIENGKMCGVSTSSDPKLILKECPDIALNELFGLKIKIRTAQGSSDFPTESLINDASLIFYTTDAQSEWTADKCLFKNSVLDDGANLYDTSLCLRHGERLSGLRIDPLPCDGKFELEYVELIGKENLPEVYIDGKKLDSHYPIKNDGGEIKVYADFQRKFDSMCGIMYTYDEPTETLCLYCKDKKAVMKKNRKEYSVNGLTEKFSAPLEFYDGQPYLELSFLQKAFDFKCVCTKEKIDIDTGL